MSPDYRGPNGSALSRDGNEGEKSCDNDAAMTTSLDEVLTVQLVMRKATFEPGKRIRLRNDLLFIIGYLEFFNALDFPANIWNTFPIPKYVVGLMATGGSAALLASTFAFIDLRRSWWNIRLLREERAFLLEMLSKTPPACQRHRQIRAWLSVNFRELGWEVIDRAMMDALFGLASILVGVGTIMAIGGDNQRVFLASNLLSGYVGNSFVALYALLSAAWSGYLYIRAKRHKRVARQFITDATVKTRAVRCFRNHQIYAITNAIGLLVAGAGSLITATMWWGYIVLIPCIFSSVFCNVFWRKKVGYNRIFTQHRTPTTFNFRIYPAIEDAIAVQRDSELMELNHFTSKELLALVLDNEMFEDLCVHIANDTVLREAAGIRPGNDTHTLSLDLLEGMEVEHLLNAVGAVMEDKGSRRALDREQMLYELLGAYLDVKGREPGRIDDEPGPAPNGSAGGAEKASILEESSSEQKTRPAAEVALPRDLAGQGEPGVA